MLKEIQCDGFKPDSKTVNFHKGLNTILGGFSAENSIGKSTMLAIIDFCFGGNTFVNEKIAEHTGKVYPINFTFLFDKEYRFSRQEDEAGIVWKCSEGYVRESKISIDDFKAFLKSMYGLTVADVSFREYVCITSRFNGRYNIIPDRPLTTYSQEKDKNAIDGLEKVFNKYEQISELKQKNKEAKDKKDAFIDARKYSFVPDKISEKQYRENKKNIELLANKLPIIIKKTDVSLSEEELDKAKKAEEIKSQLRILKRKLKDATFSKSSIKLNSDNEHLPESEDLEQLKHFFPELKFKELSSIISFHKTIDKILKDERKEEIERLGLIIEKLTSEIKCKEEELRAIDVPAHINVKAFEQYSEIKKQILQIETANKSYETAEQLQIASKVANEKLIEEEKQLLDDIEKAINTKLKELNKKVYGDDRTTHILSFPSGEKKYTYLNANDKGTGTAYKSLLLFDLCLLEITAIPYAIHDSLLFKNLGDQPVEKIMELYEAVHEKQIFISFDKIDSYAGKTPEIVLKSKVLTLSEKGNELYGWSWAKKEST